MTGDWPAWGRTSASRTGLRVSGRTSASGICAISVVLVRGELCRDVEAGATGQRRLVEALREPAEHVGVDRHPARDLLAAVLAAGDGPDLGVVARAVGAEGDDRWIARGVDRREA